MNKIDHVIDHVIRLQFGVCLIMCHSIHFKHPSIASLLCQNSVSLYSSKLLEWIYELTTYYKGHCINLWRSRNSALKGHCIIMELCPHLMAYINRDFAGSHGGCLDTEEYCLFDKIWRNCFDSWPNVYLLDEDCLTFLKSDSPTCLKNMYYDLPREEIMRKALTRFTLWIWLQTTEEYLFCIKLSTKYKNLW